MDTWIIDDRMDNHPPSCKLDVRSDSKAVAQRELEDEHKRKSASTKKSDNNGRESSLLRV